MPIKLKTGGQNGLELKAPIKQLGGGAVDSVNGQTGDVVLDIPSKTSQLINDSNFLTEHQDISGLATKEEVKTKQDKLTAGDNITIANGVISASGGGNTSGYHFSSSSTFTDEDKEQLSYIQSNMLKMTIPVYIDDKLVISISGSSSNILFYTIEGNDWYSNQIIVYNVLFSGTTLISTKFNKLQSYYLVCSNSSVSGEILTNHNWRRYVTFEEWVKADSLSDSNLYNAKELILFGTISGYRIAQYYNFKGETGNTLGLNANTYYVLNWDDVNHNKIIWKYDGSEIVLNPNFNLYDITLDYALYKI